MVPVTEVTRDAEADEFSAADYREIYEELRSHHTLRQFAEMTHTRYSIAWWSKYERGEVELTREARNELRRAVGPSELPMTIPEALADVNPNAVVYRVGERRPDRVILVGHDLPLAMRLNGTLMVEDSPSNELVTVVTRRRQRVSVSIQAELWQRLNATRLAQNLTWSELLSRLLAE
jgi:hypothetical protein